MLGAWKDTVALLEGDVHDQIEDLVVLAARNADVEVLNGGAHELRSAAASSSRPAAAAMSTSVSRGSTPMCGRSRVNATCGPG